MIKKQKRFFPTYLKKKLLKKLKKGNKLYNFLNSVRSSRRSIKKTHNKLKNLPRNYYMIRNKEIHGLRKAWGKERSNLLKLRSGISKRKRKLLNNKMRKKESKFKRNRRK